MKTTKFDNFEVKVELNKEQLLVSIFDKEVSQGLYRYACYLFSNHKILEKKTYQESSEFVFDLLVSGIYKIQVFILDMLTKKSILKKIDLGFFFVESAFLKKHKKNFINEKNEKLGEDFFSKGILQFPNFDLVEVNQSDFYSLDPFKNRTWRWKLQQLEHLNYLISFYNSSKEDVILDYAFESIMDWDLYRNNNSKSDNMVWHDHGSALRLKNLNFIFLYFLKSGYIDFNDDKYSFLLNLIKEHIEVLLDENFYSKHTNHGFDQCLSVLQVCCELIHIIDLDLAISLVIERLKAEVSFAFCSDGGHKENSPSYLNFGIKQCLSVVDILTCYKLFSYDFEYVYRVIDKATLSLAYAIKPDGFLPLIGDTSEFKVNNIFYDYKPSFYGEFLYSITKGKQGKFPKKKFLLLKESGYFFYRSTWERSKFDRAIYLSLKAGYKSNYHRHDDDLSITLFAYGEDWLVDGGIYKYDEKDAHRIYIRSHLSHNIFCPPNVSASRKFLNGSCHEVGINGFSEDEKRISVSASSFMFKGFKSVRKIEIQDDQKIFITDSLISSKYDLNGSISRLFLGQGKTVDINGNTIKVFGHSKTMVISVASQINFKIRHILCDQSDIVGWLSLKNNTLYRSELVEILFLEENGSKIDYMLEISFI
ncbi:heparinase II/III family protein [Acinetobacter sp. HR7]|uniref:heparinase II/III domain-containing protein n=1 Tax=Acinetobacter sp. HR7 TaxID=1509403 RepID=UPI00053797A2|nr:heparinase II/III family protein [Acinetobacter sp. HR7]KGT46204.1 hypothetical protein GW12_27490 [Acinetobacter sp. HR7]